MKTNRIVGTVFIITVFLGGARRGLASLEVHEWGTFTSLVGSDGVTQNGMSHEDESLPPFVHGFGEVNAVPFPDPLPVLQPPRRPQRPRPCDGGKGCIPNTFLNSNIITQKMETPVIYFYSDRVQNVEVNVKFPRG